MQYLLKYKLEPEKKLDDYAYEIYKGKLPKKLIDKTSQGENAEDATRKKLEEKKDNADVKQINVNIPAQANVAVNENDRKEEVSGISHSDVLEQSAEDKRKRELAKGKRDFTEEELDQQILITLSETTTQFMYFAPSQKYFTNKIGK